MQTEDNLCQSLHLFEPCTRISFIITYIIPSDNYPLLKGSSSNSISFLSMTACYFLSSHRITTRVSAITKPTNSRLKSSVCMKSPPPTAADSLESGSLEPSDNSVSSHPSATSFGLATTIALERALDVLFDISR